MRITHTRDTVIHEEYRVGIALVLGGLLKYLPLILDAVGLAVHIIITAQSAVEEIKMLLAVLPLLSLYFLYCFTAKQFGLRCYSPLNI